LWRWDAVDLAAAIVTRQTSSWEATGSCLERLGDVNPRRANAVQRQREDFTVVCAVFCEVT
jgi:hypothetical protein